MNNNDTVVVQAMPPGRGSADILRILGFKAHKVAKIAPDKLPKPRHVNYLPFKDADGSALNQGIAL